MKIKIRKLKKRLIDLTGCGIQYTGWPCGTCFFAINEKLNNKDWQTVLFLRGDYKKEELDNLPKDIEKRLDRILKIIEKEI